MDNWRESDTEENSNNWLERHLPLLGRILN